MSVSGSTVKATGVVQLIGDKKCLVLDHCIVEPIRGRPAIGDAIGISNKGGIWTIVEISSDGFVATSETNVGRHFMQWYFMQELTAEEKKAHKMAQLAKFDTELLYDEIIRRREKKIDVAEGYRVVTSQNTAVGMAQ